MGSTLANQGAGKTIETPLKELHLVQVNVHVQILFEKSALLLSYCTVADLLANIFLDGSHMDLTVLILTLERGIFILAEQDISTQIRDFGKVCRLVRPFNLK